MNLTLKNRYIYDIIIKQKRSDCMNRPDMLKAKLRTREEIKTKTNEYIVKENLKNQDLIKNTM